MSIDNTIYFVLCHNSNTEYEIRKHIEFFPNAELIYYRQYIPTTREFKIYSKDKKLLRRIKEWVLDNYLDKINQAKRLLYKDEWVK